MDSIRGAHHPGFRIVRRCLLAAPLAFVLPAQEPGAAAAADARQIHWQRSLDDALTLQRATGRPLLIALNMDGESASDRIVAEDYRDAAFVHLTRDCICVVASVFRHNARDHDDEGRRIPCPRLGEITCGEHMELEPVLFESYLSDGERIAPRHALVWPDGRKQFDIALTYDLADIGRALRPAVAAVAALRADPTGSAAAAAATWSALAARRDHRGRLAFEQALLDVIDDDSFADAMQALSIHGDAGALDALRPVAARAAGLPAARQQALASALQALDLEAGFAAARRWSLATAFLVPGMAIDLRATAQPSPLEREIAELLQTAETVTAAHAGALPRVAFAASLPPVEELERHLDALDAERATHRDDPGFLARYAKASLDLARHRIDSGGKDAAILLEDAALHFERALALAPAHWEWWIERARTEFLRANAGFQIACGRRALELAGDDEGRRVESLRWIGDGLAHSIAADPAAAQDPTIVAEALRALGTAAASPFGNENDWLGFGSCCSLLGMVRPAQAIFCAGARRLPGATALRQALHDVLWQCGRIDLAPVAAESILRSRPPSADHSWYAGCAWVLHAEDRRRAMDPFAAVAAYERAAAWFATAARQNAEYGASCRHQLAVCAAGTGLALAGTRQRDEAVAALLLVAGSGGEPGQLQDGLGQDVFDLVDKILEWRAPGPSPVDALALLDRLETTSADAAFWAMAISDSMLREALRAYGRGQPDAIALGDRYLEQSTAAARRATTRAAPPAGRFELAQALTIRAERLLASGSFAGVPVLLAEAAAALELPAPAQDADASALRELAATLRSTLGRAAPRERPGR